MFVLFRSYTPFLILVTLLLFSCKNYRDEDKEYVYFGGHISDAVNNKVVVKKEREIIKEINLDENNSFGCKLFLKEEGLYNFFHGNENQYFYVKNGDSIILNLNPKAFDETLSFSGRGFEKSEFIIQMFLINEKEDNTFRKFYKLAPEEFMQKIDSAKTAKSKLVKQLLKNHKRNSKKFKSLVEITLDYPLYKKIEYYLTAHKKLTNQNEADCLDPSFYEHREEVDIKNQKDFLHYYAFSSYLINYLNNLSEAPQLKNDKIDINQKTRDFIVQAKRINHQKLSDELIIAMMFQNLIKKTPNNLETLHFISENINDNKSKDYIECLIKDREQVANTNKIHNSNLIDQNGKAIKLYKLLPHDKITVLYFWSDRYNSEQHLKNRLEKLQSNHPRVHFIGINISKEAQIKKTKLSSQYILKKNDLLQKYVSSGFPLTLILNEKGHILEKDCNINDSNLKAFLKYHIKKQLNN